MHRVNPDSPDILNGMVPIHREMKAALLLRNCFALQQGNSLLGNGPYLQASPYRKESVISSHCIRDGLPSVYFHEKKFFPIVSGLC